MNEPSLQGDVNGSAANGNDAGEVVVLAANGLGGAKNGLI